VTSDLAILDGEAWPAGGMGICRQLKDEQAYPPPTIVIVGRPDDGGSRTGRWPTVSSHIRSTRRRWSQSSSVLLRAGESQLPVR